MTIRGLNMAEPRLKRVNHCLFAKSSRDNFERGLYVEVTDGVCFVIDDKGNTLKVSDLWQIRDIAYEGTMVFNTGKTTTGVTEALPPIDCEAVAARYAFDGYGWQYIDMGSGSDWACWHPDAELLYAVKSDGKD